MAVVNADSRVPAGFAVHVSPGVEELATTAPSKVVTNYKGIDHSADNGVIAAIVEDAASVGAILG